MAHLTNLPTILRRQPDLAKRLDTACRLGGEYAPKTRRSEARGGVSMSAVEQHKPIVHFVGSIPLPDAETVFRTLSAAAGQHLKRLPDGETGIRKTWIRFLQGVLADNPAIEVAQD